VNNGRQINQIFSNSGIILILVRCVKHGYPFIFSGYENVINQRLDILIFYYEVFDV
jgi:hypothetical protein